MLSRDQVLHVARLARLELTEQEQQRMSEELSKVLDHIETIGELGAADGRNSYTWVAGDGEPPAVDRRAPLAGVPLAVKDLFCTEGVPSQAGSRILEGYRPPYTGTVVRKLAEAGAPLLGKTNQDEFAMGSSNENSAFGPVLNPWDH